MQGRNEGKRDLKLRGKPSEKTEVRGVCLLSYGEREDMAQECVLRVCIIIT
jgi:hypothetical protein